MKWRKYKKLFKKKIRPKMIGMYVGFDGIGSCTLRIKDVKVSPAGGSKVECNLITEQVEETKLFCKDDEQKKDGMSYEFSFSIPIKEKKEIKKLWDL